MISLWPMLLLLTQLGSGATTHTLTRPETTHTLTRPELTGTFGDLLTLKTPCYSSYIYEPKEDITAYELSKIVQLMFKWGFHFNDPADGEKDIAALGNGARHFRKTECEK